MRILLTTRRETAERRNPIALLDLAAYARRFGHAVDCYYMDQVQHRHFNGNSYDVVGLSVLQTLNEKTPLRDAQYLKEKFKTETVVGGKWTQTLTDEQKDYLAHRGIKVWAGAGERFFADPEIDYDAYPSWSRVDFETVGEVRGDIMSTRGCPYHCHFCHNTEKRLSFFSAQRTADNIELLFQGGVKRISFCDDIFTLQSAHMDALYQELKRRNIPIENRSEFFTQINHIHEETLKWIRTYNPFQVNVGIESGDDRMLKLMGKGFDSETAWQKLTRLHQETHVPIGTLFLIGFPGETEESLRNTLRFIQRIRPFAGNWVSYYQPVRGTKGYEMALSRSAKVRAGRRNTYITYVDPNLTKKILFKYHYMMMDFSEADGFRRRFMYLLIDLLPYWLLARVRMIRQRRRLKDYMDSLKS
jgi:radical SAM superfamily enzyme YgiQ (UPF0313 family)